MSAALATIGHNLPPAPTPFELSRDEIEGLLVEARNWCDGTGVETQEQADEVSKLLGKIREAAGRADDRRAEEKRPHDDAAAEVQGRYNPLIAGFKTAIKGQKGKATLAAEACKASLAPFLQRQEAEKRAAAEAARQEAEKAAREAALAFAVASHSDLEGREHAETLAADAKAADRAAGVAEKDRAAARGGARAVSLRTSYRAELTDPTAFARWAWANANSELIAHLTTMAERRVAAGQRDIPGVTVHSEQKVV